MESIIELTDRLDKRSAIFQNLLIAKFHLAEKVGSHVPFTKITSGDLVENPDVMNNLMRESPDAQVKYSLRKNRAVQKKAKHLRELKAEQNRAANKFSANSFPLREWLRWLLTLDIEYGPKTKPHEELDSFTYAIKWNLAVAQNLLGILLIFELIAKWILDFTTYWKSFWNYVDFFVVLITTPFMGTFFGWYEIHFVGDTVLQACRTLVALKLIHELNAMKAVFELLALTMLSMVYVIVFIVIMTYLCGLIATALFDTHTVPHGSITADVSDTYVSDDQGWEPAYVFSYGEESKKIPVLSLFCVFHLIFYHLTKGLGRSILIIFKLFTLDGWYKFYKSFIQVHDVYASSAFIFTWVFLSAFLLGNLFPALLITNFQRIRSQMIEEIHYAETMEQYSHEIIKLGDEIQKGGKHPPPMSPIDERTIDANLKESIIITATSVSDTSIHAGYLDRVRENNIDRLILHKDLTPKVVQIAKKNNSDTKISSSVRIDMLHGDLYSKNFSSILNVLSNDMKSKEQPDSSPPKTPAQHPDVKISTKGTKAKKSTSPAKVCSKTPGNESSFSSTTSLSSLYDSKRNTRHVQIIKQLALNTGTLLNQISKKSYLPDIQGMDEHAAPVKNENNNSKSRSRNNNAKDEHNTPVRSRSTDTSPSGHPMSPPQTSLRTTGNRSTLPIPSTGGFTEPTQRSASHIGTVLHSNRTSNVFMTNEKERKRSSSQRSWFKRHSGEHPSNSQSGSNSTGKFANSVLQLLKLMSPLTLKRRLIRLGRHRDMLDSADIEINVIGATPRSSYRPTFASGPQNDELIAEIKRKMHQAGNSAMAMSQSRRNAMHGSSAEIKVLEAKNKTGLGRLNRPGIKSKLNLLEMQLTRRGQSVKVMRNAFGKKAKMTPSDFDMVNKRAQQDSYMSLKSMLASINKANEPALIGQTIKHDLRKIMMSQEHKGHKWNETVHSCLPALQHVECLETEWSDILLLKYLHCMAELMENLRERELLLNLVDQTVIAITDDIKRETTSNIVRDSNAKVKVRQSLTKPWSLLNMRKSKTSVYNQNVFNKKSEDSVGSKISSQLSVAGYASSLLMRRMGARSQSNHGSSSQDSG